MGRARDQARERRRDGLRRRAIGGRERDRSRRAIGIGRAILKLRRRDEAVGIDRAVERRATAGDRGRRGGRHDRPSVARGDFADRVIQTIRHIHGAVDADRDCLGVSKTRRRARAVGAPVQTGARQRRHHARRRDLPDPHISRIRHIHRAVGRYGDSSRITKIRRGAGGICTT